MRPDHSVFLPVADEDRSQPPTTVTVETDDHYDSNYARHTRDAGLRPVNYQFLIIATTTFVVLLGLIHGLHVYQMGRMGSHLLKKADDALAVGKLEESIRYLRGYIQLEPDDKEVKEKLAIALTDVARSADQRYEAFLFLEQLLKDDPAQRELRRRLIDLLMSGGRFTDAIEHLKLLLSNAPSDDQLHLLLARSYAAVGENLRAVASYEEAIRCAPRTIGTYEELAELLQVRMNDAEKARLVIDQMVASRTSSYEAYLARARFDQRHGMTGSTESDALHALQFGPDVPEVLQFVAGLIASGGDRNKKLKIEQVQAGLNRASEQNPDDAGLLVAIAQLDSYRGHYDLAEERLRKAIQDGSEDLQLGCRLAETLIAQSKLDEARIELARLGELKLAKPLEEYLAARIAMMEGRWLDAIRKFKFVRKNAASVRTLLPQISLCLGTCYENLGHVEQQLAAYREATKLNESSEAARIGLARSLARMGRISDALVQYGQVRQLPEVETQIARLLIERNLELPPDERNWDEVEQVLETAARTDLVNSLIVRSFMLMTRDQAPQARELLERGIKRHPGHAGLRVALAETHFQIGNMSQAEDVIVSAEQTLGNRIELLLARIRYAAVLPGDAAKAKLQELEESAKEFSGPAQLNLWRALAAAAAAIGDTERWRTHLEAVAEKSPDDLGVIQSLYSAALQTGPEDKIERWLQEIRRIQGDDGPETKLAVAQRLMMTADRRAVTETEAPAANEAEATREADTAALEKARELLNQVNVQMPGSPRVALGLAHLETLVGNEDLAIDHYSQAIDYGETNPEVFNRMIRLLYKQRRYTEAADVVERLKNIGSVSLAGELGRVAAEVSIRSKDLEQASHFAEQAVSVQSLDYRDHLWRGQILWAAGQSEQAEACMRRAIELAPDQDESWIALIQFLGRSGRSEEAQQEMSNLQARLSVEDASYTLGQCYQALNQPQEAEQQYQLALKSKPNDEQVLWTLAQLYLARGRWPEAEDLLRRLIALNPSASVAASTRRAAAMVLTMRHGYPGYKEGLALLEQNLANAAGTSADRRMKAMLLATRPSHSLRREAIAILETLDENSELNQEDQINLIRLYIAEGDLEQARLYMTSLMQSHGNNPEYLALCVRMLLQHGEVSDAVMVWLEKLEQLQPDQFRTLELRARVLVAQGKVDEALTRLKDLARKPSEDPEQRDLQVGQVAAVLADLAAVFDRSGRQQIAQPFATAAEEMYREVASRRPERIIDLIRFLGSDWQLEEAFALCDSAWQIAPPQVVAATYVELLRTREATPEQLQQAQRSIQAALLRDPESGDLLFQLANTAHLAGKYAEAESMYRRAIPNASPTLAMLASNELALLLALHRHETGEAIQLMNQAIELNGPLSFLLDTRATVYLAAGDTGRAIRDLEQAIADTPTAANKFHLAQAWLLSGDTVAAAAAWRESMSLGLHLKGIHPLERSVFDELNSKLK